MVKVGSLAPTFECTAVVERRLAELSWPDLHGHELLVLAFDPAVSGTDSFDELITLGQMEQQLAALGARAAVVCRDRLFEILEWVNRERDEGGVGDFCFPIIIDVDNHLAWRYDLLFGDEQVLSGRFIIDARGVVRQITETADPVPLDPEELLRCVRTIREQDAADECL